MLQVLVLDTHRQPMNSIHPGEARRLLDQGKAAVFRRNPFTIILKTAAEEPMEALKLKTDSQGQIVSVRMVNKTNPPIQ